MGIYIQGIELPKEQNVPTWAVIFSNGEVRIYKDGFNTDQGNGKGTAVPIPPHGRLGDLDDFAKHMKNLVEKAEDDGFDLGAVWYSAFVRHIELTPTIIEAEEAQP